MHAHGMIMTVVILVAAAGVFAGWWLRTRKTRK
jgi:hypothetical protein